MTAPMLMTDCPTEETLAAYLDDRLDAATRRKVTEHISSCGECRELVLMATDFQQTETPAKVVSGKFGWFAPAAGLAAAAVIAIFVLRPAFVYGPDINDVMSAYAVVERRPSAGRGALEVEHKEMVATYRGKEDDGFGHAELLGIAADAKDSRVRGVALLLNATKREDYDAAVTELEAAHRQAGNENRDEIAIDLANALIGRARWTGDEDFKRALLLSDAVWKRKQTPAAAWNRAVALESLDQKTDAQKTDAISAWNDYLKLDPSSPWAEEARRRQALNADP